MVDFRLAVEKNVKFAFYSNQQLIISILLQTQQNYLQKTSFSFIIATNILQTETANYSIKEMFLLCSSLNTASLNEVNAPYRLLDPLSILLEVTNYGIHVFFCLLGTDKSKWTSVSATS